MRTLTKKRMKAGMVDMAAAAALALTLEKVLPEKVRKEPAFAVVFPVLVSWGLEYSQLKISGQTIGLRQQGLVLEDKSGQELTSRQIIKRIFYRDFVSPSVLKEDRQTFEGPSGSQFPHDRLTGTVIQLSKR